MSLLNTTDTASGANVPDAGATTKWKDYIWVRRLGTSGEAKFYIWNENATSDATYLKWQEKSDVVVSDISMTSGQILVGGSTGLGTSVAMSGDATISNAGAGERGGWPEGWHLNVSQLQRHLWFCFSK